MNTKFNVKGLEFEYLLRSFNRDNKQEHNKNFKKIYDVLMNQEIYDYFVDFSYVNSLVVKCHTGNLDIYIESYIRRPDDDDVFESLLIVKEIDSEEIMFVETNTLNNNLYKLNIIFNGESEH